MDVVASQPVPGQSFLGLWQVGHEPATVAAGPGHDGIREGHQVGAARYLELRLLWCYQPLWGPDQTHIDTHT